MKTTKILFSFALILCIGFASCNKAVNPVNPTAPLPDASFSATISGDVTQQINASMPNQSSSTNAASGGYTSTENLWSYTFLAGDSKKSSGQTQISFQASAPGFSNGTYQATEGVYLNVADSKSFGELVSGTITITKNDLYQNSAAGSAIYWVSGSANLVIEDAGNPGNTITINFQFSNINTVKAE